MPLAEVEKTESPFRRTEFFRIESGVHTLRILDPTSTVLYFHFVLGKYSVQCLGDDCPICERNKKIIVENPNDFRNVPGYYNKQHKHYWNVLDRTDAIHCPSCDTDTKADLNGRYPTACPSCGAVIQEIEPKPLDMVKVFSLYDGKAEELALMEKTITNKKKEVIGWTNYDVALSISYSQQQGGRRKANLNFQALAQNDDEVNVEPEELYELESAVMHLEADEITALFSGVSLSDIYKGRRPAEVDELPEDTLLEADDTVEKLVDDLPPF